MRPRESGYIAAADLLRVFCVGLVAWFHIWQQSWLDPSFRLGGQYVNVQQVVRHGYMMVDVMLLLSGFLLYLPVARRARQGLDMPDTADFFRRRAWRILPSYWLALLMAAALLFAEGPSPGSPPFWKDLLTHLSFTQVFWKDTYVWTNLNVVLWTLAVEVQFYLIFPALARLFRRAPWAVWAGMTALALLCRFFVSRVEDITILFNQLPCMLDLYAFGMLAAHLLVLREDAPRHWAWGLGSLCCLAGLVWVMYSQSYGSGREQQLMQMQWRQPIAFLAAGFLWFGGQWSAPLSRVVGNPLLRFLSAVSYNFYIWHQYLAVKLKLWQLPPFVTEMPQKSEGHAWQLRYTVYCWAISLAAAALITYLVERPCARWGLGRTKKEGLSSKEPL